MKTTKQLLIVVALTAALTLSAKATFIADPTCPHCGGLKGYIDVHNSDTTDFTMFAGHNGPPGFPVAVHTNVGVDTGSGFATIKPVTGSLLTELVFTPANDLLFSDFNFRGQLLTGSEIDVTVIDSNGTSFTIQFTGLVHNPHDFSRIGVTSLDGETIKSVTVDAIGGSFKEFKQVQFSRAPDAVPDGGATLMLLGAALGVLGVARRFLAT